MLKPDTERIWSFLKAQPALAGFILVGGSALAIHLGHRWSEDLVRDYHEAFRGVSQPDQAAIGVQRLCSGKASVADEGFEQLAPDGPTIETMTSFFREQRDAYEREEASRARNARSGDPRAG